MVNVTTRQGVPNISTVVPGFFYFFLCFLTTVALPRVFCHRHLTCRDLKSNSTSVFPMTLLLTHCVPRGASVERIMRLHHDTPLLLSPLLLSTRILPHYYYQHAYCLALLSTPIPPPPFPHAGAPEPSFTQLLLFLLLLGSKNTSIRSVVA